MGRVPGCPQDGRQWAAEGREGGNGQGGTRDHFPCPGALGPSPDREPSRDGDFPGGPVAETPLSQRRRLGFSPWSGNEKLHAAVKSLHAITRRSCALRLRLRAVK